MKVRMNPWPAGMDLFSSLVAVSFGALMLYVPYSGKTPVQVEATSLRDSMERSLRERIPRRCGEDLCLDVDVRFEPDKPVIDAGYEPTLRKLAADVRAALSQIPADRRGVVQLTIEGHTDRTLPRFAVTERDRVLYNWRLSSERAASVLYLFSEEGLRPPDYRVLALGYADSEPLECALTEVDCNARNRRTTFRIRIDTALLERVMAQDDDRG